MLSVELYNFLFKSGWVSGSPGLSFLETALKLGLRHLKARILKDIDINQFSIHRN